ncbi:TIGR03986 family type III CRISPR-associated RAMP protein [Gandjariella thermophila]|uniref:CRISPR-associated RAMP family protein n=1 Tax=Gandjariella thermophila TaxID=1931992 RepID=A0A4D4J8I4_9PSEU|nr:TIGR03986 family CRISPR-associated RAMP protein [Gandjariella thermophila]GDY31834.1 hypothetical protein GTS_34670 [Gandjariella thermophila]
MPFHNPYNFIPALRRDGDRMPEGLRDAPPAGHHRWHENLLSGRIDVRMTVVTPLLVMRGEEIDGHTHLQVALTTDPDGVERCDLPATSVKGMLRSAYEAVTNSRLSVFDHDRRLGYRCEVSDELKKLQPALIHSGPRVEILGDLVHGDRRCKPAIPIPTWKHNKNRRDWQLGSFTHRQVVEALISRTRTGWRVETLLSEDEELPLAPESDDWYHVRGILHITGPNIESKRAERLFVTEVVDGRGELTCKEPRRIPESGELVNELKALIKDQIEVNEHAGNSEIRDRDGHHAWEYLGHEPGRTAWSRHLYEAGGSAPPWTGPDTVVEKIEDGAPLPCWAEPLPGGGWRLRPVMVSRLPYDRAPIELLDPSLRPAESAEQCSPADRVFGWSNQDGTGAHRAQLRITRLTCPTREAVQSLSPLTLPPLATPKPTQGRFYLADDEDRPLGGGVKRSGLFRRGQKVRGRKVYPHHQWMENASTNEIVNHIRYQLLDGRQREDKQNATIHGWIKPGAEFTFTVEYENLHRAELGALLWLLDPHLIGEPGKPGRLRLGWGKPLGFGSVELSATAHTASTGAQIRHGLRTLRAETPTTDVAHLATEFAAHMNSDILEAFRRAAAGYPADEQVSYPRNKPREPGYEWFVKNEKASLSGKAQSLPKLGERMLKEYIE